MTSSIRVVPIPIPGAAPPATVLEEVTKGYVPWSRSSSVACAPSSRTVFPSRSARSTSSELLELEWCGSIDPLEPHVFLRKRDLELLPEDLRVEQVLDADPEPEGLVGVGRPDPPFRRPDLQLAEPPLAALVDRDVPRHDHVRVRREMDPVDRDSARSQLVELFDQDLGIDHAARADHTLLAAQDPGGDVADLVGLAADNDRVPSVRPAVVAADKVRVLGEQVDDLALAFVSPLGSYDHGRRHSRSVPYRAAAALTVCCCRPALKGLAPEVPVPEGVPHQSGEVISTCTSRPARTARMRWPRSHSVQARSWPRPSLPRTSEECSSPKPSPRLSQAWQTTAKSVVEPRRTIVCSNNFSHLPIGYAAAARSANFAYRLRNESLTASVGPFRCLARITSARPC